MSAGRDTETNVQECVFGVFHSCETFVNLAKGLWYPFDAAAHMPDHLLKCLHEHLTKSAVEIVKLRIQRLKRWTSWASELAKAERDSKQRCDPKVEAVLGAKRLLLMEGVAKSINWARYFARQRKHKVPPAQ